MKPLKISPEEAIKLASEVHQAHLEAKKYAEEQVEEIHKAIKEKIENESR